MVLPVCPTYTFLYSNGVQYTPGILRPKVSLTSLTMWKVFFPGIQIVLISCLASNLLILLNR